MTPVVIEATEDNVAMVMQCLCSKLTLCVQDYLLISCNLVLLQFVTFSSVTHARPECKFARL